MPSLLDKSFVYHNAASHSDPLAFRERMIEYAKTPAISKWDKPASMAQRAYGLYDAYNLYNGVE